MNVLFGIGAEGFKAPEKPGSSFAPRTRPGTDDPTILYQFEQEEAKRKAEADARDAAAWQQTMGQYEAGLSDAQRNRQAREQLYGQTREDTRNYYLEDLQKQHEEAQRNNRFFLARRGLSGGSRELDMGQKNQEEYDRAVLDIGARADDAANSFRIADEEKRLNLLNRIQQGMDAVAAKDSAITGMQLNLEQAKANSRADGLGNIFSIGGQNLTQMGSMGDANTNKNGNSLKDWGTFFNGIGQAFKGTVR